MRKTKIATFIALLLTALIVALSFVLLSKEKKDAKMLTASKGFAVVELFTSEGCSSCPPADAAIAKLVNANIANTFVLAYHVDYWDRLGWKDPFSQASFSERQKKYSSALSLDGVYTPQVIVNGTAQFVGSNESTLKKTVDNDLNNGTASNLGITAARKDDVIVVRFKIIGHDPMLLNTAIIIAEATTQVKRGENGGKSLKHVNIVCSLKTTEITGSGEVSMEIPKELYAKPFKLIAYTQDLHQSTVFGADQVEL